MAFYQEIRVYIYVVHWSPCNVMWRDACPFLLNKIKSGDQLTPPI